MNLPASMMALLNTPLEETASAHQYPSSDGEPMADNSRQLRWIVFLYTNLYWLFHGRDDVAVHGNMLWYVEEFDTNQRQAPDVMVIFGRPPMDRESYLQWTEDNVPVTVAFEILSPSKNYTEMREKQDFYEEHGVEEYYEYDPQINYFRGYHKQGQVWLRIRNFDTWVSPRLGIRFLLSDSGLRIETREGEPFLSFDELALRYRDEKTRADSEKTRADSEARTKRRAIELGRRARLGQATNEELAELERLEAEAAV